jgi:hypothetical protein
VVDDELLVASGGSFGRRGVDPAGRLDILVLLAPKSSLCEHLAPHLISDPASEVSSTVCLNRNLDSATYGSGASLRPKTRV